MAFSRSAQLGDAPEPCAARQGLKYRYKCIVRTVWHGQGSELNRRYLPLRAHRIFQQELSQQTRNFPNFFRGHSLAVTVAPASAPKLSAAEGKDTKGKERAKKVVKADGPKRTTHLNSTRTSSIFSFTTKLPARRRCQTSCPPKPSTRCPSDAASSHRSLHPPSIHPPIPPDHAFRSTLERYLLAPFDPCLPTCRPKSLLCL